MAEMQLHPNVAEMVRQLAARAERAEAALARAHRLAVGWQEPVLSFVSVHYPDAATALLAALDAQRPAEPCICGTPGTGNFEGPLRDCPVHGEQPSARSSAEPYCFCADCIRCGCGMWERHHANASEIVPQRPAEGGPEGEGVR